jgi:hypothetical protein
MSRIETLTHKFVEFIPSGIEDGILYISIEYATAVHKCCCGCGNEVPTPLTPTDWELIFNGETVSLYPSIGNWSFPCQSHYFIKRNRVKWAKQWTKEEIDAGRAKDALAKERYLKSISSTAMSDTIESDNVAPLSQSKISWWNKVKRWLRK